MKLRIVPINEVAMRETWAKGDYNVKRKVFNLARLCRWISGEFPASMAWRKLALGADGVVKFVQLHPKKGLNSKNILNIPKPFFILSL